MKRIVIAYIIVLAGLTLTALIGIQIYWIKNAMYIKEENFKRDAREALVNVANKLERREVARLLENKIRFTINNRNREYKKIREIQVQYDLRLDSISDSLQLVMLYEAERTDSLLNALEIYYRMDSLPGIDSIEFLKKELNNTADSLTFILDSLETTANDLQTDIESAEIELGVFDKYEVISNVYEDLTRKSKNIRIEDRVDEKLLDSLLRMEFKHYGIKGNYEYGIFNPAENRIVMEKSGKYHEKLKSQGLATNLFPRDFTSKPRYLLVYFPDSKTLILRKMIGMVAVSGLIVLILIYLFTYTINTIIRQKKLSEMKNDFINNMTHEFKTPISTVALACEAMSDKTLTKSPDFYHNYIGIIDEENKRLGVMAEKILETATIDKGQINLKDDIVDIHELLTDVIKKIRVQVEIKDGRILTTFNAENIHVRGDGMHLQNVFFNLLDNANKYSPKKPDIQVKTKNDGGSIVIEVKDNGVGISKSNQRKVFDKLYRIPTGNVHDVKGFGLGLSYVKLIVEKHKGKVNLESEPGQGSLFRVTLHSLTQ